MMINIHYHHHYLLRSGMPTAAQWVSVRTNEKIDSPLIKLFNGHHKFPCSCVYRHVELCRYNRTDIIPREFWWIEHHEHARNYLSCELLFSLVRKMRSGSFGVAKLSDIMDAVCNRILPVERARTFHRNGSNVLGNICINNVWSGSKMDAAELLVHLSVGWNYYVCA